MSTKTTDTNQIQYQPSSLGTYNQLQPQIAGTLGNFMQNPLTSSFFNQRVGMGAKQISQSASAGMQSLLSNLKGSGVGGNTNPFLQSQIARAGRATSGLQANNFMNQLFNANQMQLGATGMAQAYNPLMTGSTGTQTRSGLGTWLPQLAGAGLGAATGGLFGGGSGGGGFQGGATNPGGSFGSATPPPMSSIGQFPGMGVPTFPNPIFMGLPGFGG